MLSCRLLTIIPNPLKLFSTLSSRFRFSHGQEKKCTWSNCVLRSPGLPRGERYVIKQYYSATPTLSEVQSSSHKEKQVSGHSGVRMILYLHIFIRFHQTPDRSLWGLKCKTSLNVQRMMMSKRKQAKTWVVQSSSKTWNNKANPSITMSSQDDLEQHDFL